ncbi:MAG: glycine zipper 2TM domain-containing protein [Alphaproteobacteria bacterium]|nr:MAG: glycine zipper 2TM domain-containing protein [Alphaproteobacteria bacterium]
MRLKALGAAVMIPVLLAACGPGRKQETGTLVGAVTGALIGSQIGKGDGQVPAAIVGAFIGGVVGSSIGQQLDEADRRAAMQAQYQALEFGSPGAATPWRNPRSGHYGSIVPGQPYQYSGRHCRDYTHTIYIGGQPHTARGKACRNPDGTWQPIS